MQIPDELKKDRHRLVSQRVFGVTAMLALWTLLKGPQALAWVLLTSVGTLVMLSIFITFHQRRLDRRRPEGSSLTVIGELMIESIGAASIHAIVLRNRRPAAFLAQGCPTGYLDFMPSELRWRPTKFSQRLGFAGFALTWPRDAEQWVVPLVPGLGRVFSLLCVTTQEGDRITFIVRNGPAINRLLRIRRAERDEI